jgi:deoxycytidylate deaminase
MSKRTIYSPSEVAGLKLLATAIKRNVERVERRYRNKATREACQAMAAAADAIIQHAEHQRHFTVYVAFQPGLIDYETDDSEYGAQD